MLALQLPPGARRRFAFMGWPRYREGLWNALLLEADRQLRADCPLLLGADRDGAVLEAARRNALRAGVLDHLSLQALELKRQAPPVAPTGLALCNPPYGTRLGRGELHDTYRALGSLYKEMPSQWQRAFLCPDPLLAKDIGLPLALLARLQNGGIRIGLYGVK
jgi:putative N6-adenine-specific DNA methylase